MAWAPYPVVEQDEGRARARCRQVRGNKCLCRPVRCLRPLTIHRNEVAAEEKLKGDEEREDEEGMARTPLHVIACHFIAGQMDGRQEIGRMVRGEGKWVRIVASAGWMTEYPTQSALPLQCQSKKTSSLCHNWTAAYPQDIILLRANLSQVHQQPFTTWRPSAQT